MSRTNRRSTMSEKSHVGMLHNLCPICGEDVRTDILLDKRLKASLEKDNYVLSDELCKDCEAKREEYIALLEVSNSPITNRKTLKAEDAIRTGRVLHLRRRVWPNIFDVDCPQLPLVFIDVAAFDMILAMMPKEPE